MSQIIVLVTFYSRTGATETLATAAAVGAVQARAGIRMRRLPDVDQEAVLARYPESAETLRRMWTEYVPPKEADLLAADGVVVGLPDDLVPSSIECAPFFELLNRLSAEGKLARKAAAVVGGDSASAVAAALRRAGFTLAAAPEAAPDARGGAIALGRRLVSTAESLKG